MTRKWASRAQFPHEICGMYNTLSFRISQCVAMDTRRSIWPKERRKPMQWYKHVRRRTPTSVRTAQKPQACIKMNITRHVHLRKCANSDWNRHEWMRSRILRKLNIQASKIPNIKIANKRNSLELSYWQKVLDIFYKKNYIILLVPYF
jgi:hypothetical protein